MYFCVHRQVRRTTITVRDGTIMPNHLVQAETGDSVEVAVYVASITADLANMARHAGLDTLGYLLEIVRLEAENAARNLPPPSNGTR